MAQTYIVHVKPRAHDTPVAHYAFSTKAKADKFRKFALKNRWMPLTKAQFHKVSRHVSAMEIEEEGMYEPSVLGEAPGSQSSFGVGFKTREKKVRKGRDYAPIPLPFGGYGSKEAYDEQARAIKFEEKWRKKEEEENLTEEQYAARRAAEEEAVPAAKKRARKGIETKRAKREHKLTDEDIQRVMHKRSKSAIMRDLETTAKVVFRRDDPRAYLWELHPGRYDLQSVDTKNALWWFKHLTTDERAKLSPEEVKRWRDEDARRLHNLMTKANKKREARHAPGGGPPPSESAITQQRRKQQELQEGRVGRLKWAHSPEAKKLLDYYVSRGGTPDDPEALLDQIDPTLNWEEKKQAIMSIGVAETRLAKKRASRRKARGTAHAKAQSKKKRRS